MASRTCTHTHTHTDTYTPQRERERDREREKERERVCVCVLYVCQVPRKGRGGNRNGGDGTLAQGSPVMDICF